MGIKAKTKDELIDMLQRSVAKYAEQQQELVQARNEAKDLQQSIEDLKAGAEDRKKALSDVHNQAIAELNTKLRHHESANFLLTESGRVSK